MSFSFFTPSDLAEFRRMSEAAMDCLATIQTASTVRGPGGTSVPKYTDRLVNVPCRLSAVPGVSTQILTADQLHNVAKWLVVLPVGTVVNDSDQIVVTGTDGAGQPFSLTLRTVGHSPVRSNQVDVRVQAQYVS